MLMTANKKANYIDDLIYKELSYKTVGCFYNVYNELGPGFKESVYQKALVIEFDLQGVPCHEEKRISVN